MHEDSLSIFYFTDKIRFITDYEFNSETGIFNYKFLFAEPSKIDLSKGCYIASNGNTFSASIMKVVSIEKVEVSNIGIKYKASGFKCKVSIKSYNISSSSLYAPSDDFEDTFYYRGAVSSNYVKLGNYYFRIIRVNGDGSVR